MKEEEKRGEKGGTTSSRPVEQILIGGKERGEESQGLGAPVD